MYTKFRTSRSLSLDPSAMIDILYLYLNIIYIQCSKTAAYFCRF